MGNAQPGSADVTQRRIVAAAPGRLDTVLAAACPDLSRARIQRLIADGLAQLNGGPARKAAVVVPGDVIELAVPPYPHGLPAAPTVALPILYEDDFLLAIDKPPGLAVHGAPGDRSPSVASWMLTRLGPLADAFDVEHPGIVHRLDKDTSGVLLLAKTPAAQSALSHAFEARTVEKTYLAITDEVPNRTTAIIDAPIARHPGDRTRMAVVRDGRASRTRYEVLAQDRGRALLLVNPETGRTHQIRVHLAAIRCPVTFDTVYGRRTTDETPPGARQLLHAWRIDVPHPDGGHLEVTASLPDDFAAFLASTDFESVAGEYVARVPARRYRPDEP